MHKYCQVCLSDSIIPLTGSIYCQKCDVYYQIEENTQYLSSIPVTEVDQTYVILCKKCEKFHHSSRRIKCRSYKEYLKKLRICQECKTTNLSLIKNLYYRNFISHKKTESEFGLIYKALYFFTVLSSFFNNKTRNNFSLLDFFSTGLNSLSSAVQRVECKIFPQRLRDLVGTLVGLFINSRSYSRLLFLYSSLSTHINSILTLLHAIVDNLKFVMVYHVNRLGDSMCSTILHRIFHRIMHHTSLLSNIVHIDPLILFSPRHILFVWCMWLKLDSSILYPTNVIRMAAYAFFLMHRVFLVDVCIFMSGFSHIYYRNRVFYEIPENMSRSQDIKEITEKLRVTKIYNNHRSNSEPILLHKQ